VETLITSPGTRRRSRLNKVLTPTSKDWFREGQPDSAGYWGWNSVVKEAIAKDCPTRPGKLDFHWGRELVRSNLCVQVQVELSGRTALVDAWFVPDGFFSKGEEMILSRGDSARLGYRFVSEEEDSVDDGEDVLPSEWVPGPILTSAEVPAQVRRDSLWLRPWKTSRSQRIYLQWNLLGLQRCLESSTLFDDG